MTTEYPKINGVFKRDRATNRFIMGDWAQEEFGYLQDTPWLWTEKVDGTNIRLHYSASDQAFRGNEHAYVAGRTDAASIPPHLLQALVALLQQAPLEEVFPDADDVVLYGEGYGAKIQKGGGDYRPDAGFVLFDVRVGPWWLKRDAIDDIGARLGIDVVPVVDTLTLNEAIDLITGKGFASAWPGVATPEGVVGRPAVDLFTRRGERITTKVKHKDFH